MSFVRAKSYPATGRYRSSDQRTYYYLVESHRDGEKVRQRTLAYLGVYPSLEAAILGITDLIPRRKYRLGKYQEELDHLRTLGSEGYERGRLVRYGTKIESCEAYIAQYLRDIPRLESQLQKLLALQCSAHECLPLETLVGTTEREPPKPAAFQMTMDEALAITARINSTLVHA